MLEYIPKVLNSMNTIVCLMVNKAKVKMYEFKSRHSINLPCDFVKDSAFPFKPNEELIARIDGQKVIIERGKKD